MIRVKFACGHEGQVSETADAAPICGCGERQVVRTQARAPRFVGACTGPYCETRTIEPGIVQLAPGGSLNLKAQE